MSDTPDTSIMAKLLGQNWQTTAPGILFAIGTGIAGVFDAGIGHKIGLALLGIGGALIGINARSAKVSTAQMDAAQDAKEQAKT
jgi:hypothetical protein